MSKIETAIGELMDWSNQDAQTQLPASAAGLLDIAATGLADFGVALPEAVTQPDGAWMARFFGALAKAARLEEPAGGSARTRYMAKVAREHATYHVNAIAQRIGGLEGRGRLERAGARRDANQFLRGGRASGERFRRAWQGPALRACGT